MAPDVGEDTKDAAGPDAKVKSTMMGSDIQSRDAVSIYYDTGQGQEWQRVIPITDRPHLPSHVRLWWGDSRGRWDGDTLVVDVTNFSPKTEYQGSRENLHLVERWKRKDANTIEIAVTIEDPTTCLLTEGLHSELLNTRVRVTVVFPGAVGTNITANSGLGNLLPARAVSDRSKRWRRVRRRTSSSMVWSVTATVSLWDQIQRLWMFSTD